MHRATTVHTLLCPPCRQGPSFARPCSCWSSWLASTWNTQQGFRRVVPETPYSVPRLARSKSAFLVARSSVAMHVFKRIYIQVHKDNKWTGIKATTDLPQYMNHRKNNAEEVTCKGCVGCNVFHVCVDPGDFCTYRWLPRTHIVQGKKEDSENRQEQKRTRNS